MREITGIILAGGRAQRMGGEDKGLTQLQGRPMIQHVIKRLRPQVSSIIVSANRNQQQYERLGYPVVSDGDELFNGPLAGVASAIHHARTEWVLVTPCDTPLLPLDLASRLMESLQQSGTPIAVAHDGERMQQLCFLASTTILDSIQQQLAQGERRVRRWIRSLEPALCQFDSPLSFANINTPEEQLWIETELEKSV